MSAMIKRICIGGPLNEEVALREPVERFTCTISVDSTETEQHEYRRVHVFPGEEHGIAVFAHQNVTDGYAIGLACLSLGIEHPA